MSTIHHQVPARSSAGARSRTQRFLKTQLWVWPLFAAAMLVFAGFWVRHRMEGVIHNQIASNLGTIRDANAEALRGWASSMKAQAELLAGGQHVRSLVERLATRAAQQGTPQPGQPAAPEVTELRARFKPLEEVRGFSGYAVLDTNFVVLAAGRDELVGANSPPEYAEYLRPCLAGKTIVTAPFVPSGMTPDETGVWRAGLPVMFAAAPLRSEGGVVIGLLGLRILPQRDFTRILATARSGASGETYIFNRAGVLLSESRFDEQLKHLGLIPDEPRAHSLLALELRDPGVDLRTGQRSSQHRSELLFTKPVRETQAGRDGFDTSGHRDYRGVPVVGAWAWLPDFDFGLVTEMDLSEALAPLRVTRGAFWSLFGLLTLCSVVVFIQMHVAGRFHERAREAALEAKQLGQYALDDEIGSGGFGTVFRAHHALMRRPVAVKVLSPFANEQAVARFEREVQATCQLNHPNTIALYDYGHTDDGCFYYAMEYLDGLSLAALVEKHGAQPEGRVIYILRQVCASLAEAHARGLVHRDIKPQNIFLTCRGGIPDFVKVLDFGLVKARDNQDQVELTASHATLGTPRYMSPEVINHPESVDGLADIYSLGAVGYELLTGQPVFFGRTVGEILLKQLRDPPDPPALRLKHPVSPDLEELLLRCLAKEPSARPAGAVALDEALGKCVAHEAWTRHDAQRWWDDLKATQGKTLALPKHYRQDAAVAKLHVVGL